LIDDFQEIDEEGVENDGVYFKKDKLKSFIQHFKNRMETVVFCLKTGKELCYRDIIKNQVYELIRCLETGQEYKPYRLLK
jgi:CRISPR/Cas system-associated endonuclease Cas1